ncbi:MAG: histidine triad nucleotide-binding protein [Candidatus Tritonobacter lacicola]|nr:histidine triad nucleotide-binding protein [Candidatus Tritonobacter lacicola]
MMGMSDCLFCNIMSGKIPGTIVHEDDGVVAFEDVNPQTPVHILIVPRRHIRSLNDLEEVDAGLIGRVHLVAKKIAREKGIAGSGYRLVCNCGPDAGQAVGHIHFHLIGGRPMSWPPG